VTFQVEVGLTWQILPVPQNSNAAHLTQVSPPSPQASLEVPDSQFPALQHPFLQLDGPQAIGSLQVPCWQVWPEPQATQAPPPVPQAVTSVAPPKLQLWPLQHPLVQVAGEHPEVQTPFAQTSPDLHVAQTAPSVPQAPSSLPELQTSPAQQPFGQEAAVQTHVPSTQAWLLEQLVQSAPPFPHLLALGRLTQAPLSQQPVGQVEALHPVAGVSQTPPLQTWVG
jgi:hypothetical protein